MSRKVGETGGGLHLGAAEQPPDIGTALARGESLRRVEGRRS